MADTAPNSAPRSAPLLAGIAGSMSGVRNAHTHFFQAAQRALRRHGVATLLGDDASAPEQARLLARQFVDAGVHVVIGHFNSACAQAVIPVYRAHDIALLLPACTDVGLPLGLGVYRLCGDDAGQARAIAERIGRLRRRDGPLAVAVRIDGSDYARRLLECLHQLLDDFSVAGLDGPPADAGQIEVVIATAPRAVAQVNAAARHGAARVTIYADEAAVAEFASAARAQPYERYVVTPQPSYGALLARGCDVIAAMAPAMPGAPASLAHALAHSLADLPGGRWALRRCAGPQPVAASAPDTFIY